ncbi:MAG: histidinol-phosphate transaminase [Promicromonosporaceae bacterium]|nr:histidinol-phosphate transaminase [Promicromonosporaceae bacterium]
MIGAMASSFRDDAKGEARPDQAERGSQEGARDGARERAREGVRGSAPDTAGGRAGGGARDGAGEGARRAAGDGARPGGPRPAVAALPPYVPGARPDPGQRLWKLSSNENPYPPLPSVLEAVARAAESLNRYPDMYATDVAAALAAHAGVDASCLVVGNGSVAVLAHLLSAYVEAGRGDEVVFAWRSFEAYPIAVDIAGGRQVRVPLLPDGRHDLPAMLAAITPRTRMVLVCSPNNPTGPTVARREFEAFLAAVPPHVLVVFDEAYLEFVAEPTAWSPAGPTPEPRAPARGEADEADCDEAVGGLPATLARRPNLVILRTLSKAYGLAGLRVGYCVAVPEVAAAVRAVATPFGVTGVSQEAALASLAAPAQEELWARVSALIAERERVTGALREQGWSLPDTQANFVWFPLGEAAAEAAAEARAAGILVRPFAGEGIRVSIGEPEAGDALLNLAARWRRTPPRPGTIEA